MLSGVNYSYFVYNNNQNLQKYLWIFDLYNFSIFELKNNLIANVIVFRSSYFWMCCETSH
jgi:hypothetical protein